MNWLLLILAGCFETAFAFCLGKMRETDGTAAALWGAGFLVFLTVSMVLLVRATRTLPIGTAYAVWTGIGAVGMMIEGLAVGIGTVFFAPLASLSGEELEVAMDSKFRGVAIAGLAMTGTGIAGLITGTTVYCVYKKRLNNMVDSCNSASHLNVSLGMQQHGVGLAVIF